MPDSDIICVAGEISRETRNKLMKEFKEMVYDIERHHRTKLEYKKQPVVSTFYSPPDRKDNKYEFLATFGIFSSKEEAVEEFNKKIGSLVRKYKGESLEEL